MQFGVICHFKTASGNGPIGSFLFAAGSPTDTVDSQTFRTFSTRQIAFFVAGRLMPAMLLRLSASLHIQSILVGWLEFRFWIQR